MNGTEAGRDALAVWQAGAPTNFSDATPNLDAVLRHWAGPDRAAAMRDHLHEFGAVVATVVEPAVRVLEHHRQLPEYVPVDGVGRRVEGVEFHPAYHDAGRAVWASGILGVQRDRAGAFEQFALFYLLAHAGEGGHGCPVVCTAGLGRALQRRGPEELAARYLPGVLTDDYDAALRGSQFLTEVQGGSDVGANAAVAVPDGAEPNAWRITGEKWFCSVADADLFAVTARPAGARDGTAGLGCFLVPRTLDGGTPNGFRISRLKDKLGTRALASAEIDFDGALGWPIGSIDEGFHIAVEDLLNTSRWLNAAGSTGIMRRACLESISFARHRKAFGRPLDGFPLVREHLAVMTVEEQAALASSIELTALVDRIDRGAADDDDRAVHRVLVNANKFVTSIVATDVVHRGIEVFGGNGTIEDFSPLPRLYRDAVVFESWEGTHNVLCAQVRRDCARFGLLDPVLARLRSRLETLAESTVGGDAATVATALDVLEPRVRRAIADDADGAVHFRRGLEALLRAWQASALLAEAAGEEAGSTKAASAALFVRLHLVKSHEPADDPGWLDGLDAVLGDGGDG